MGRTTTAAIWTCWSMRCRGATLFDLGGLHEELEAMLGMPVDLLTPGDLSLLLRDRVLGEAVPV